MGLDWLSEAGLDIETGLGYTGGEEKYLSAIRRFYQNYEKNLAKVTEFYAAKDYENYMITVHALKSNARMIGALDLSTAFETLEHAARDKDIAVIESKTETTLVSYKALIDALKPIEELGDVRVADEISAETARDISEKLLVALDDFDDELSKELAGKLAGYPFRITQKEKLKEATAFIDNFMYDEAADLIREISATIE